MESDDRNDTLVLDEITATCVSHGYFSGSAESLAKWLDARLADADAQSTQFSDLRKLVLRVFNDIDVFARELGGLAIVNQVSVAARCEALGATMRDGVKKLGCQCGDDMGCPTCCDSCEAATGGQCREHAQPDGEVVS